MRLAIRPFRVDEAGMSSASVAARCHTPPSNASLPLPQATQCFVNKEGVTVRSHLARATRLPNRPIRRRTRWSISRWHPGPADRARGAFNSRFERAQDIAFGLGTCGEQDDRAIQSRGDLLDELRGRRIQPMRILNDDRKRLELAPRTRSTSRSLSTSARVCPRSCSVVGVSGSCSGSSALKIGPNSSDRLTPAMSRAWRARRRRCRLG